MSETSDQLWGPEPVSECRAWLQENLESGVDCPCCGQRAQSHRRGLHASMLKALAILRDWDRQHPGDPVKFEAHLSEIGAPTSLRGDVAKLAYWGLIERWGPGRYRISALGRQFVDGEIKVPRYAVVYNGDVIAMAGDTIEFQAP